MTVQRREPIEIHRRIWIASDNNPVSRGPTPTRKGMDGERIQRERWLREAVLAGNEGAWRTWYDESYSGLEAYVRWRCAGLRDLADDVLQETWMTAVRAVRRFRPEVGSFAQWLAGIAAN